MLRMIGKTFGPVVLTLFLIAAPTSRADHTVFIDFVFADAPGRGFLDPVLGPPRREALFFAADLFGGFFASTYSGQTVLVETSFQPFPPGLPFGALAGPFAFVSRGVDVPVAVAENILRRDLRPLEGRLFFNEAIDFLLGTGRTPGSRFSPLRPDLVTLAMHELGHIFGFDSNLLSNGTYILDIPTFYDLFISDEQGRPLVNLSPQERIDAATGGDTLFWHGSKGVAANGGIPPNMSAGRDFVPGSNVLHLSQTFFGPEVLMDATVETVIRELHPVERGMFEDLLWTLTPRIVPVPEPGSLALLGIALAGLACVFARAEARKKLAAIP